MGFVGMLRRNRVQVTQVLLAVASATVAGNACNGNSRFSCDQLSGQNFKFKYSNTEICGQSKINGVCPSKSLEFAEAEGTCTAVGARLCTPEEFQADAVKVLQPHESMS